MILYWHIGELKWFEELIRVHAAMQIPIPFGWLKRWKGLILFHQSRINDILRRLESRYEIHYLS